MEGWSQKQLSQLRELFGVVPVREIVDRIGKPKHVIQQMTTRLGLRSGLRGGKSPWSDAQIAQLRELYGVVPSQEIGDRIGKSTHAVTGMAWKLGLKSTLRGRAYGGRRRRPSDVAEALRRAAKKGE